MTGSESVGTYINMLRNIDRENGFKIIMKIRSRHIRVNIKDIHNDSDYLINIFGK